MKVYSAGVVLTIILSESKIIWALTLMLSTLTYLPYSFGECPLHANVHRLPVHRYLSS